MTEFTPVIKAAVTVTAATVGSAMGYGGWLALFFVICAAVDWVTGSLKAMKKGGWASSIAREGLWHKTGEFISVAVAAGVDLLIWYISAGGQMQNVSYKAVLLPVVCVWYICTELGSIIENIGEMGAPVPEFLCRMIEVLKGQAEKQGNKISEDKE